MKKFLKVTFCSIIFLSSATLCHADILYLNNFNDGNLDDWEHIISYEGIICGSWTVVDGTLKVYVPCTAQNFRLNTLILPESYIIEFDTKTIIDGNGASLIGFYTHWSTWSNWVGQGYRPGRFLIEEIAGGGLQQRHIFTLYGDANRFQWHHFKYIKDGDWSSLYYDYDYKVVHEDLFFPISLTDGYFVLAGALHGTHQFDNLLIRTLEISIDDILTFFDYCVSTEALMGNGPGNSAGGRLKAFRNMLETSSYLIESGDVDDAVEHLMVLQKKCDGDNKPPDFVDGNSVSQLADMIEELIASLE